MFTRLALTLSAAADPAARRLGLVADSVNLWLRARRLRQHWQGHEQNCHRVIENAIEQLAQRRTCLVLGSGLQRDVPLPLLAARFEKVVLLDCVHLWPARRRAAGFPNVELITLDVSGKLAEFASNTRVHAMPSDILTALAPDLTISANLLSQLPIAAEEWLDRKGASPAIIAATERQMIADHLALLSALPGRICLITDIERREIDRHGEIRARTDLLAGLDLPPPDQAWDWTLAPPGFAAPDVAHIHRVHGYGDWRQTGLLKQDVK